MRWRRAGQLERLQLTPVYVFGLLTFLLATAALAGAGDAAGWATFTATALLPFAFLVGLLRSHVARLDADLRARVEELRASRARLVEAGDTERRRLERNLHDGAQARLVGLAMLLGLARRRVDTDPEETGILIDRALVELRASLAELRELARGIHPAVLTERGLGPALNAIAARAPVPVDARDRRRAAPAGSRRGRRVLRRRRGAGQRREVRPGDRGHRRGPPDERTGDRRRQRRRHRGSRRGAGLGPTRPRRPGRRPRRHAVAGQPTGSRYAPARRDPVRAVAGSA